ncbi:MAG: hypothetical protein HXM93_04650, partial [Oribacterium parvum]|nr:hypothetical protein [Oribacterium parvum]
TGEGSFSGVDFEGNYAAFLKELSQTANLPKALETVLFGDGALALSQEKGEIGQVMEELFSSMEMESPEDLKAFLQDQQKAQIKFSGNLFNNLRGMLSSNISPSLKNAILNFGKTYNDFASSGHFLQQMETIAGDIDKMLLPSFQGEFEDLLSQLNFQAEPGKTEENTSLINNQIIPFMSNYISRTHDYGAVRNAVVMFILYAVKYENGSEELLAKQKDALMNNPDFRLLFKGNPEEAFKELLDQVKGQEENAFPKLFTDFLKAGAEGKAGTENISHFQEVLHGLLVNESVYMPLQHLVMPFRYDDKDVMSEMWVEQEAKDGAGGKLTKMLLKFNIQSLGNFEIISGISDMRVDLQLFMPEELMDKQKDVEDVLSHILRRNGLSVANLGVYQKTRDFRIQEVFPEIKEAEKGLNVRI